MERDDRRATIDAENDEDGDSEGLARPYPFHSACWPVFHCLIIIMSHLFRFKIGQLLILPIDGLLISMSHCPAKVAGHSKEIIRY